MKIIKLIFIFALILSVGSYAYANNQKCTMKVIDFTGKVAVIPAAGGDQIPATIGMALNEGDTLKTMEDSWALLNLQASESANVEVEANSELLISRVRENSETGIQQTLLDLAIGKVLINAQKIHNEKSKFEIQTPTSVVGVRGTTFEVEVQGIE